MFMNHRLYQRLCVSTSRQLPLPSFIAEYCPVLLSNLHTSFGLNFTANQVYDYLMPGGGTCACGDPSPFLEFKRGYQTYCSKKCAHTFKDQIVAKREETSLRNHGVRNPAQSKSVKRRIVETNLERYGHSNPAKSELIKKRIQERTFNKYGVRHPLQRPDILRKQQRSAYTLKRVKISGKWFSLQGYEPQAVRYLLSRGVDVKDITAKETPTFEYEGHVYNPDLFIKNRNLVIEVKSTYTAGFRHPHLFKELKRKACAVTGFRYLLLVMNEHGLVAKSYGVHNLKKLLSSIRRDASLVQHHVLLLFSSLTKSQVVYCFRFWCLEILV
jgi:hypothetical protein